MSKRETFRNYQLARRMIQNGAKLGIIYSFMAENKMEKAYIIGIKREYRAFYGIKAKYSNHTVLMSDAKDDKKGIDIIAFNKTGYVKFAISGPGDKEKHKDCNVKVVVEGARIGTTKNY